MGILYCKARQTTEEEMFGNGEDLYDYMEILTWNSFHKRCI
jgi:hypothetical protein